MRSRSARAFRQSFAADAHSDRKNNTPPKLWQEVTERVFIDVEAAVEGWTQGQGRDRLFRVPTVGTLTPAPEGTTGNSGDWLNEIHPSRKGWAKLAQVWRREIKAVLPQ
ncbi:MAG: hypothetical protein ABI409_02445 [Ramlibacter sp.]